MPGDVVERRDKQLKRLSQESQATLYMTLLAAFGVLLARYSGQDDIVVGSPIANRQEEQLEEMIGFFVNSLVMRIRFNPAMSFRELLAQVRGTALEAYRYQDVPFERLVEELSPQRSLNSTPLFQVILDLQNMPRGQLELSGLQVDPVRQDRMRIPHDLELHVFELDDQLGLSWLYKRDLFSRWRVEQMARQYLRVLETVSDSPNQRIAEIDFLDKSEVQGRLDSSSGDNVRTGSQSTVVDKFSSCAQRQPNAIAVAVGSDQVQYGELNRHANQLGRYLRDLGVGPEERIGVCLEPSIDLITAVLGVLKAGGAFVALDPSHPVERLRYQLTKSKSRLVISRRTLASRLELESQILYIEDSQQWARYAENLPVVIDPKNLAYLVYTSGSTGVPKAVMIEHHNLTGYIQSVLDCLLSADDVKLASTSALSADLGYTTLFSALCSGRTLVLIPPDYWLDSDRAEEYFRRQEIDVLKIVPSHLRALEAHNQVLPRHLLILGGEPSETSWLEQLQRRAPSLRIVNHYSPTETTVGVLTYKFRLRG